ncbi:MULTISPECIES: hypothetical protein [Gracilibacillus]|nr:MULTISPECIES: hypothetical protein [Gracilibacillus]
MTYMTTLKKKLGFTCHGNYAKVDQVLTVSHFDALKKSILK